MSAHGTMRLAEAAARYHCINSIINWIITGRLAAYKRQGSNPQPAPPFQVDEAATAKSDKPGINNTATTRQQSTALSPHQQDNGVASESTWSAGKWKYTWHRLGLTLYGDMSPELHAGDATATALTLPHFQYLSQTWRNHESDSPQFSWKKWWNWTIFWKFCVFWLSSRRVSIWVHMLQENAWSALVALERTSFGRFRHFRCVCDFKSLVSLLMFGNARQLQSSGSAAATQRFTSGQTSDDTITSRMTCCVILAGVSYRVVQNRMNKFRSSFCRLTSTLNYSCVYTTITWFRYEHDTLLPVTRIMRYMYCRTVMWLWVPRHFQRCRIIRRDCIDTTRTIWHEMLLKIKKTSYMATPSTTTWNVGSNWPRWNVNAYFQSIFARSASAVASSKKVS